MRLDLVAQRQAFARPADLRVRPPDQALERVNFELDDVVVLFDWLTRQPDFYQLGAPLADGVFAGLPLLHAPLELGDVRAQLLANRVQRREIEESRLEHDRIALCRPGHEIGRPTPQLDHARVGDRVNALLRLLAPWRNFRLDQPLGLHAPQLRINLTLRRRPQKPNRPLEMPHQVVPRQRGVLDHPQKRMPQTHRTASIGVLISPVETAVVLEGARLAQRHAPKGPPGPLAEWALEVIHTGHAWDDVVRFDIPR